MKPELQKAAMRRVIRKYFALLAESKKKPVPPKVPSKSESKGTRIARIKAERVGIFNLAWSANDSA